MCYSVVRGIHFIGLTVKVIKTVAVVEVVVIVVVVAIVGEIHLGLNVNTA